MMNTIDKGQALVALRPNAQWVMRGDELEWLDKEQTQPTQDELDTKQAEMQAEYDSLEYARMRKAEYDQLNQFELQFDDAANGTTTWADAVNAIKAKYPKE